MQTLLLLGRAAVVAGFILFLNGIASGQSYEVSTVVGTPGATGATDTVGALQNPQHIGRDTNGNFYVAEINGPAIRKVTPGGVVSTFAGTFGLGGSTDGTGSAARFSGPMGVTVDQTTGNVFVSEVGSQIIRQITPAGVVTTLAGTAGSPGSTDGTGAAARFSNPVSLVADGAGNLYVCDANNLTVRKIVIATKVVTTLAGSAGQSGSVDGTGSAARFRNPRGIAMDATGNIIVGENSSQLLRKITPAGVVTTLAGQANVSGGVDGTGAAAQFRGPNSIAVDTAANTIYVGDFDGKVIRKVTADGVVTTLCGLSGVSGTDNGAGSNARFTGITGLAVDGANGLLVSETGSATIRRVSFSGIVTPFVGVPNLAGTADTTGTLNLPFPTVVDPTGNVYVAESNTHVIRKVLPSGQVLDFVGQTGTSGTTDGTGSAARFNTPVGLALDAGGNLYVAERSNHTIRKVTPAGVVTTFAGQAGVSGAADGPGSSALFNQPEAVAVDAAGTVYVAESSARTIRQITALRVVTTLAGQAGASAAFVDAVGTAARFQQPRGLALDGKGNLFISDGGVKIRKLVLATGAVTTSAGSGASVSIDGVGTAASLTNASHLAFDGAGNLYFADSKAHTLRKMNASSVVSTVAGRSGVSGALDGVGGAARFNLPLGVATDAAGNVFVGDFSNHAIRKVTPGGVVTTFAGTRGKSGTPSSGVFNGPADVARDSAGNLYVPEVGNHIIRKITPQGVVTTFAGQAGVFGEVDGTGGTARFTGPTGVAVDASGNLFVAEFAGKTIRRVSSSGTVTTLAGLANTSGTTDGTGGTGGTARFASPNHIAIDPAGQNLYVSENLTQTIRKVAISNGTTTTFAGSANQTGSTDATGAAARFNTPLGLCTDSAGNLYVADLGNHTIRKITTAGVVTTFAGSAGVSGSADGTGTAARFNAPKAITIDSAGNLLVTEFTGARLRKITPAGVVTTLAGVSGVTGFADGIGSTARFNNPAGMTVDPNGVVYIADAGNQVIRKAVRASAKAQLIAPVHGSALVDPVTTFSWNAGVGVTQYALWVGTTSGGFDIYAGSEGTNLSRTLSNIPTDKQIFVTLWSLLGGTFQSNSYVFDPVLSGKGLLLTPANGSTLSSGTLALSWIGGPGVTAYAIWVGSSPGGFDIAAAGFDKYTTAANVTVPTDGAPIYVKLWSFINGALQSDERFVIAKLGTGNQPAQMTQPATNGSKLDSQTQTFSWSAGTGVGQYALWVGSTPDGFDLYAGNEGLNTSKTLSLPTDGRQIFVTLHSLIGSVFQSNSYTYTCSKSTGPAKVTAPANGTSLAGTQLALTWNSAPGATQYALWIGSTPGGFDLHASAEGLSLSRTVTGMPTDGRVLHVTLWSQIDGVFKNTQSFFNAFNSTPGTQASRITSPVGGSSLTSGTTTFTWDAGAGVTNRVLWLGSTPGGFDLYVGNETLLTRTLTTLPTDGRPLFATLHSLIGGEFRNTSYTYTAAKVTPAKAVLTSPPHLSTLTSASATFSWTAGTGVTSYALWIGSAPGGFDLHASGQAGGVTSQAVTGLPTDGRPMHVTLWSLINGAFQTNSYILNAFQSP